MTAQQMFVLKWFLSDENENSKFLILVFFWRHVKTKDST